MFTAYKFCSAKFCTLNFQSIMQMHVQLLNNLFQITHLALDYEPGHLYFYFSLDKLSATFIYLKTGQTLQYNTYLVYNI